MAKKYTLFLKSTRDVDGQLIASNSTFIVEDTGKVLQDEVFTIEDFLERFFPGLDNVELSITIESE